MIGEFHFGALDRGMFHTGLVPVENQAARAQAYKDYVLGAARHPSGEMDTMVHQFLKELR